ncbi:MAG: hypothetical protein KF773_35190 [Deltaproteobacteria bacterium]|nr:hypothetical protein [Deltaproteobacteria bacterium]MCW5805302.1 hypothetical protein [Deltaproteobacteria bacterium]
MTWSPPDEVPADRPATPFGAILRRAVEATPGAVGGAFADADGEMVDAYTASYSRHDWAVLTATYGVVMSQLHAAFGLWHCGGPEYFIATHSGLGIAVHVVGGDYFALLAVADPARVTFALAALRVATHELEKEMA